MVINPNYIPCTNCAFVKLCGHLCTTSLTVLQKYALCQSTSFPRISQKVSNCN